MDDDDPEEVKRQFERVMTLLATCQWVDQRTKLVQAMNQTEMSKCDKVYEDISHAIAEAQLNIEHERDELIQARKIRKNRMEYDALAKVPTLYSTLEQGCHPKPPFGLQVGDPC